MSLFGKPPSPGLVFGQVSQSAGLGLSLNSAHSQGPGERRLLAHQGVSYNLYKMTESRICAERPAVPDPCVPPGFSSSLQEAIKIHPSCSPLLMPLGQFGIRLTGACGFFRGEHMEN